MDHSCSARAKRIVRIRVAYVRGKVREHNGYETTVTTRPGFYCFKNDTVKSVWSFMFA